MITVSLFYTRDFAIDNGSERCQQYFWRLGCCWGENGQCLDNAATAATTTVYVRSMPVKAAKRVGKREQGALFC